MNDIGSGDLRPEKGKSIYDYILDYQKRECDQQVYILAEATGLDINRLKDLISKDTTEDNIDEHGRFMELIQTHDRTLVEDFLKKAVKRDLPKRYVISTLMDTVREFILDPNKRAKIINDYQDAGSQPGVDTDKLPEEDE